LRRITVIFCSSEKGWRDSPEIPAQNPRDTEEVSGAQRGYKDSQGET